MCICGVVCLVGSTLAARRLTSPSIALLAGGSRCFMTNIALVDVAALAELRLVDNTTLPTSENVATNKAAFLKLTRKKKFPFNSGGNQESE